MIKVATGIANILVNGKVVGYDDRDKLIYGIDIMLSSICEILCVLVISLFVRNFLETVLFFIMFIPLRIYAGGYHADTRLRCFAILLMVYAIFSVLIALCGEDIYRKIMFPGLLFTMIMVIGLSPVLHSRKHLTQKEILVFRRFAITICAAEIAVIVIAFCIFGCNVYVFSLVCGQLAVSLSMGAACIKKYIKERGVKK